MTWAAVILTGGSARRLQGTDKAGLEHRGRTLLENALAAVAGAAEVVVVGPEVPTSRPVTFTRETPSGAGPLAAVAAGADVLGAGHDLVVVLAVDMPYVEAATVTRLLTAVEGADAAWLTDADGRRQLAGVVRPSLVPSVEDVAGAPMRLLMTAGVARDVAAHGHEADDVDSWDDVARLREIVSPGDEPARRDTSTDLKDRG